MKTGQKVRKIREIPKNLTDFWSEYRDSNPRPLGPEPSAIPNFAIPRNPIYYNGIFFICQSKYWILWFCFKKIILPAPIWNSKVHRLESLHLQPAGGLKEILQTGSRPEWLQQPARKVLRQIQKKERNTSNTN